MDASLSFELIAGALGPDPSLQGAYSDGVLPTPERLQELLAQAEVQLFIGQGGVEQLLLQTGWFLHGVASADEALGLYEVAQQRQAFAVSAHIFDLACQDEEADELLRLQWAFAAQVGFHRSEAEPNAGAIGRRVETWAPIAGADIDLTERLPSLALRAGIALLTLDAGAAARRLTAWNRELLTFEAQLGTSDAGATVFGPTLLVVHACYDLLRYLREGNPERLATAQGALSRAVSTEHEGHDHIARWVASHIRSIGDAVARGSVWTVLPPSVPDAAKQAFTMTSPHVLTLWQPQRELLTPSDDPGRGHPAKRLIVSVPTSAGKTLIGQLLMVEHLATRGTGVCYVAPQRSLGREVRRGLMRRLRLLARELARQAPDAGLPAGGALADLLRSVGLSSDEIFSGLDGSETHEPDIAIMTPERLSHALREDPEAVLSRYGMFVFDEAHQIRESGRGFLLESVISYLHWRSRDTEHRIVLLSAVLGNAGQIRSWLDPREQGRLLESNWRGPRRLSVLFGVSEDKQAPPTIEPVAARGSMAAYTQRRKGPMHGVFRLKPTGREVIALKTRAALGQVSYRTTPAGLSWSKAEGSPHSTPKYRMLAQLVSFLGRAGSVLVVCDERKSARNMARAIAETLPPHEQGRALALTARIKLGEDHPLPATLEHGVAYHHAGLPSDLLESIEDAVRQGELNYLVSTSTLTEGVNLPVRTVVLSPAYYPDQPEDQKMAGPRLVNAVGRAGRAVLETEGWVVLAHYGASGPSAFNQLDPTPEELATNSVLTRGDALAHLEQFEANLAAAQDAAMAAVGCVADFQAFVWFALAASDGSLDDASEDPASLVDNLDELLSSTLAFGQLPDETRRHFQRVAVLTAQLYLNTDMRARRSWARAGTSVNSARALDILSDNVAAALLSQDSLDDLSDPVTVIRLLHELDVWTSLLRFPERPREWKFAQSDNWQAAPVAIDVGDVLTQWLEGASIPDIADGAFAAITDRRWRLEVAVDTTSDFCEHYFAWLASVLTLRVNERLSEAGSSMRLCEELGTYLRYGVSSHLAVELLTAGLRSREVANAIAEASVADSIEPADIRDWIGRLTFSTWQDRFAATQLDLVDLIEYARPRSSSLLRDLLLDGRATLDLAGDETFETDLPVVALAHDVSGQSPYPIGVYEGTDTQDSLVDWSGSQDLVGHLPPRHYAEAELVLGAGVDVAYALVDSQLILTLRREV